MQCKCGAEIIEYSHQVKTKRGFREWHDAPFVESHTPYTINKVLCRSCGRVGSIVVVDNDGNEVLPRWPELYCDDQQSPEKELC
jgi:hypothetical protein